MRILDSYQLDPDGPVLGLGANIPQVAYPVHDSVVKGGGVVLLNGTSSAGKGTIAVAMQARAGDQAWLHQGLDRMLEGVPASLKMFVDPADGQPDGAGWTVPFRDGAMVGAARVGPVALQLLDGMYRASAGMASAGNRVILDDVIYDKRVLVLAALALSDTPTLFVGVRCPVATAMERELQRGDRARGGAAAFHPLVHEPGIYDLEVDTSLQGPDECARVILKAFGNATVGGALQRAAAHNPS